MYFSVEKINGILPPASDSYAVCFMSVVHNGYAVQICKSTYFFLASSYCQLSLTLSASSDDSWVPNYKRENIIIYYWA